MSGTEFTYPSEDRARMVRREAIIAGRQVSLIAYDPTRNAYVFDVYDL